MTYVAYRVLPAGGAEIGLEHYDQDEIVLLTQAQARYARLSGLIAPASASTAPPIVAPDPVPVTETNTTLPLTIDGSARDVTIADLLNLFPRMRGAPGETGPEGPDGPEGPQGEPGPSVTVNGKSGAVIILDRDDIGLDQVANLAPANLPVSTATQAALDQKLNAAKVGVPGGTASLDAISGTIPLNQIPSADLPVPNSVTAAIAQAISNLIGGADGAYDTLLEIENLLKGDDNTMASLLAAVNARLIAANNLSDIKDPSAARANLGVGSLGTQNLGSAQLTGGVIDNVTIGKTTPAPGTFTNLTATGAITGTLHGNADTATTAQTWAAARNLSLAGFVNGSVSVNGSQDVTITTSLTTTIPVASGGTGATTAAAARANLYAAKSGANTDITSLNAPDLGAATAATATSGTNTTQVATTAFVTAALVPYLTAATAASTYLAQTDAASTYLTQVNAAATYLTQANATATYLSKTSATATYAPLVSAPLTGTPTAPTAAPNTNNTQVATTAYADASAAAASVALAIALG